MARAPKSNETETAVNEVEHDPETGEVAETASLSSRALATVDPSKFKVKRQITRPLLKHAVGETVYIRILSKPYLGKEIKSETGRGPATLINVQNLLTGAPGEMQYILSAALYKETRDKEGNVKEIDGALYETFGDKEWVGTCLAIRKFPKAEGKDYHTFEVLELEDPKG